MAEADQDFSAAPRDPLWDDWDAPPRVPETPELHLDGFDGPLSLLLDLVERARIDLSRLSVGDMVDQFVAALTRYERDVAIDRRADWLLAVARLLLLRSRLFLARTPEAQAAARAEAERELTRLQDLQFIRAAATWLEARPQIGRDVFIAAPRHRAPRVASYMALLDACLTLLEREEASAPAVTDERRSYQLVIGALFRVPEALARMRAQLQTMSEPQPLGWFLPKVPDEAKDRALLARSAVASAFVAALELTRTHEAAIAQSEGFGDIALGARDGSDISDEAIE